MLQAPPSSALSRSILIPARGTELPISDGNTPSFISHHGRGNFLFPFCASLCIVTYTQHRCILRIALSLPIPPYNPPLPLSPAAKRSRAFALPLSLYLAVSFPFLVIPAQSGHGFNSTILHRLQCFLRLLVGQECPDVFVHPHFANKLYRFGHGVYFERCNHRVIGISHK